MILELTPIKDLIIIQPNTFLDSRGFFFEAYNQKKFLELGISYNFIQDNQSFSKYGTIRGLHLQINPYPQAKLVRVLEGEILDVVVDLREKSETYGKHYKVILSSGNKKQLMVPPGFAHGFAVLSEYASVMYKVDNLYDKESERGVRYDDSTLAIDWTLKSSDIIISDKDMILPNFKMIDWQF
jgi:dTDP-4-dehydrorhamnose 3,5-epimerase